MSNNSVPFHSPYWPAQTAHQIFWDRNNCPFVYEYDPTDDGPETEIGRGILEAHTAGELSAERIYTIDRFLASPNAYSEAAL
jgi:hypothetical protein